ncbi:MAG: LuxR C-terminal-related transcriptional regulator, partial [Candidatus Nanopelagicales bacterium]|nr:LuxR C-terminal-related transcriptional regulator [Candidatus Nanopelagicales bacterium]
SQTPRVPLTDAQVETLRLLAYGLSNAEIARVRVVSEKSVEQAIKRAATALDIPSDATSNQRVALARAFFSLTGATRHRHAHR